MTNPNQVLLEKIYTKQSAHLSLGKDQLQSVSSRQEGPSWCVLAIARYGKNLEYTIIGPTTGLGTWTLTLAEVSLQIVTLIIPEHSSEHGKGPGCRKMPTGRVIESRC